MSKWNLTDICHSIPVEDLASNGESVRTKIFHIVCALCDQKPAMGMDQDLILDWYNMVSWVWIYDLLRYSEKPQDKD